MRSPHGNPFVARAPMAARTVPGIALVVVVAAAGWFAAGAIGVLSPLVVGLLGGALVANTIGIADRWRDGVAWCARRVLRIAIVLLGLRLSLGDLAGLGARGLVVVAGVVTVTFIGTRALARWMGISDDLGLLVATGYSICGASAIAAMDAVVGADEEETAYAISLVTLCGTLSIAVLPALAPLLGLDGVAFGTWVGGAVHDVGQVVATAAQDGADAVRAATVVKLTRVVLLAPLVATIAVSRRRRRASGDETVAAGDAPALPPIVPLFVVGFLAAIVVRSTGLLSDGVLDAAADVEKILLTVALTALGMGVDVRRLRNVGGRPLALGMVAWVLVAGSAYAGTALVA